MTRRQQTAMGIVVGLLVAVLYVVVRFDLTIDDPQVRASTPCLDGVEYWSIGHGLAPRINPKTGGVVKCSGKNHRPARAKK